MRKHENQSKPIYHTIWWRNSAVIEQYSESHWTWRRLGVFHLCFREFFRAWTCFWRLSKVCSFYIVYNLKSRSTDLLTMESVYIYFTCFRGLLGFGQNPKWFLFLVFSICDEQFPVWWNCQNSSFHNCIFFSSHQKDIFISIFWTYIIFLTIKNVLFGSTDKVSATPEWSSNNLSSIKFDLRFLLLITKYEKKNKYTGFFFKLLSIYEIDAIL